MRITKPHVRVMKEKYRQNAVLIQQSVGVNCEEYNQMVFDYALHFIRDKVCDNDDVVSKITAQEEFWLWWVNQWNLREDAFVNEYFQFVLSGGFEAFLYPQWKGLHHIATIKALIPEIVLKRTVLRIEAEQKEEVKHV